MAGPGGRGEEERTGSPPTDRVVAIVELLAAQQQASSVASIASRLELNRSTVTSILLALERAGWVTRHADRSYTVGPGLLGVASAVRESMPLSTEFAHAIADLAERAGCGASVALVGAGELSFVAVTRGKGRIPPGVGVGVRLPLVAPAAAAVIAHRDKQLQEKWLASARDLGRDLLEDVLTQVRTNGVAVFGLGNADPKTLDMLAEVVELLAEHPRRVTLRQQVFEQLTGLGGNPYTSDQLATEQALSVSYLTTPIFEHGQAVYELQLGPLRDAVSATDRDRYIREIRSTAASLST